MQPRMRCGECGIQMDEFESYPIDVESYPVDEALWVCLECYESFYWYYDQTEK